MKANKPLKEAILRAPESTDENQQPQQEQLYHLGTDPTPQTATVTKKDIINESSGNRIKSLHNLRELEYDVEKIKAKK